jgi:ATP synthase protein I
MVSTLVAGPRVWGGIGMLIDSLVGTTRIFLPLGIVLGFFVSFYIVYVRFGRETETIQEEK